MKNKLFREEAVQSHQPKWMGEIILLRPVSFAVLTLISAVVACVIMAFLVWGSYTKRTTVQGQLVPNAGLVKIYAPVSGIILDKKVAEGQQVHAGDVLYILSTTQYGLQGDAQAAITEQINIRDQSLQNERNKLKLLHDDQRMNLANKIQSLKTDQSKIQGLIEGQQQRVALAQDALQRYQQLLNQDYISNEQFQQKKAEFLDQQTRLQGFERDKIAINSQLQSQQVELEGIGIRQQSERAQLDRQVAQTQQELTESQVKQKMVIRASESGIATAIVAEAGQQVDLSRPLLSIIPRNTVLVAQLYVPSKAIGFIRQGDRVILRYQAYPYQKFGHAKGRVSAVARTALTARELNGTGEFGGSLQNDPVYLVKVSLDQQAILAYGKPQALQAGALLEADIMQEKRRLYEWVLEPLYSITGKI